MISIYKYIQHRSTCFGILLFRYVLWKYRGQVNVDRTSVNEKRKYWAWSVVVTLVVCIVHALLHPYFHILQIRSIIVSGITSVFVGFSLFLFYIKQENCLYKYKLKNDIPLFLGGREHLLPMHRSGQGLFLSHARVKTEEECEC